MREPDICIKTRKCGWVGTDDEKAQVPSTQFKGLNAHDLVCPKCGGRTFYAGKEIHT